VSEVRTNEELAESAVGGLRWITLARVGSELLLVSSMVVLARVIPPSAFGMFAVAILVQEIAMNLPNEGVGSAIVQRREIAREHLQAGLALSLVVGAVLAGLTLLLTVLVVKPLLGSATAGLIELMTPLFLIGAVLAVPSAVLRRRLDFRLLSVLELVGSLVRSIGMVLFAVVFGLDAGALALGTLASMAAVTLLALILAPVPLPRWHRRAAGDLLKYGGPASLATIAWSGFRNCDYAIIAARLGSAQAGFYWRGFQLAVEYQRKITSVMSYFGFPVLARTAGMDELLVLRQRMVRLTSVTLFPVFVTLVLLAPVAVPFLLGPGWEPAILPTQILAGAGAATVLTDNVGSALQAAGRARTLLIYGMAHFGVYVVAVLFASRHGIAGVSIAAVTVHSIFLVIAYYLMLQGRPERTVAVIWGDISAASISCVALVAAALPVNIALASADAPPIIHMAVVSVVAAVAYLGVLRAAFNDAWQDLATIIRRVLPSLPAVRAKFTRTRPPLATDPPS
jgi:O-antigen/teichoic acid export membrane protein